MSIQSGDKKADEGRYGFHYFDKPDQRPKDTDKEDEEDDMDVLDDLIVCENECCDLDCECDDCSRCSNYGTGDDDTMNFAAA